jgi:peptidoglycan/LPS O-acetylase OafA/YrhL
MTNQKNNYTISFKESATIKGLLILLIILGHCHYLFPHGSLEYKYLFQFHVQSFFILPFFYDRKEVFSILKIRDIVFKCYVPYIFFFILCTITCLFLVKELESYDFIHSLYSFFIGEPVLLKQYVGMAFMWFLSTYCTFSILKMFFYSTTYIHTYIQYTILSLGFLYILFSQYTNSALNDFIPFAFPRALSYFTIGFLTKYIVDKVSFSKYIAWIVFIMSTFVYFYCKSVTVPYFIFPISFFIVLLSLKDILLRFHFLQTLGILSLSLYLVNNIVINLVEIVIRENSIMNGFVIFIISLFLCWIIAEIMNRVKFIQKLIIPKGYNDFVSLFSFK